MIIVLADKNDGGADALVRSLGKGSRRMAASDLLKEGWLETSQEHRCRAVIGAAVVDKNRITGLVNRLTTIDENDLLAFHTQDRAYVRAELCAFLYFWLISLRCPVINRPDPGVPFRPTRMNEVWCRLVRRVGLGLDKSQCHDLLVGRTRVTVLGNQCAGTTDSTLKLQLVNLTMSMGFTALQVDVVRTGNVGTTIVDVESCPEFGGAEEARLVMDYCRARPEAK